MIMVQGAINNARTLAAEIIVAEQGEAGTTEAAAAVEGKTEIITTEILKRDIKVGCV